jgi:hypothetical protein
MTTTAVLMMNIIRPAERNGNKIIIIKRKREREASNHICRFLDTAMRLVHFFIKMYEPLNRLEK